MVSEVLQRATNRRGFVKSAAVALTTGLLEVTSAGSAKAAEKQADRATEAQPKTAESSGAAEGKRPNVLLILADDLGWSDLGCYGGEIQTPNVDSLARNGLRFTQFYNSARCCPSRAAILTGLNPHQAGFPLMSGTLPQNAVTLPEVLKTAGYKTYMVGKWHLGQRVTPVMRGFDEFYGMLGGFNSYWQEEPYQSRLPEGRTKRSYAKGEYYSTNAFGDYALDFLEDGQKSGNPWFMYLAFNAPHFPLHAPEAVIEKYEALYRDKGWDGIRSERLARQKTLGLVPKDLKLTPRGAVPANFINRQTGWADKEIPAWDTLAADRQTDLARRMAIYAAAVDIMDQNIGRVLDRLKKTGEIDNTIILFLSDNGACAEWDPYGFDKLDSTLNIVHKGEALKEAGGPDSYISYGAGWALACDTPWRLFKHYTHEGGIRTPLLVHWPQGLKIKAGGFANDPGYITDFMPTLAEVCGARYPTERNNIPILPTEGESLVPVFQGKKLKTRQLCVEHEGNRMVREGDWKLVAIHDRPWELYQLSSDPTEMVDLASREPERVKKMEAAWTAWAVRCNVISRPAAAGPATPQIANRLLTIRCEVVPAKENSSGVLVAQGGNQQGYALYLDAGKPIFGVRINGKLTSIMAPEAPTGKFSLEARLAKDGAMTLLVNGKMVASGKTSGLIPVQPKDGLTVGEDTLSAVGNYAPPNTFRGKVEKVMVEPTPISD